MTSQPEHRDFFISYNNADEAWAVWVAWTLEQEGYSATIQAWDFRPGSNFVVEMQAAIRATDRTIAILSPDFLRSTFTTPEWSAAFAKDPMGANWKLVPVRVRPCDADGLLGQVVRIDLVDCDDIEAKTRLLSGLQLGRGKPSTAPAFPGKLSASSDEPSIAQTPTTSPRTPVQPDWQLLPEPLTVTWRDGDRGYVSRTSTVELHLVATEAQRIEVRRLNTLKDELAAAMRSSGLVPMSGGVKTASSDNVATAQTSDDASMSSGLSVFRNGQCGGWFELPCDGLGAVLDPAELRSRVAALLRLLVAIDLPRAKAYGLAIGLTEISMLTVGSESIVGNRSSSSYGLIGEKDIHLEPDDAVDFQAIGDAADTVAEELVARLTASLTSRR